MIPPQDKGLLPPAGHQQYPHWRRFPGLEPVSPGIYTAPLPPWLSAPATRSSPLHPPEWLPHNTKNPPSSSTPRGSLHAPSDRMPVQSSIVQNPMAVVSLYHTPPHPAPVVSRQYIYRTTR